VLVELLTFDGCPNEEATIVLVAELARELGLEPDVQLIEVRDSAMATRLRFLGAPTIRIDGRDVEPAADDRRDYGLGCRLYQTPAGLSRTPDRAWVRSALMQKASDWPGRFASSGRPMPQ
jgi:hypothetical protein